LKASSDVFVVTRLDRLARSVADLVRIVDHLRQKSVALRVMALGIDTGTPTGKLMANLLGSIAEFERDIMLERQREGIAKAKSEGKFKGRKPTARAKSVEIIALAKQGVAKGKDRQAGRCRQRLQSIAGGPVRRRTQMSP
jgi:DNA invertase Pin-like site-specific DNA recombinase